MTREYVVKVTDALAPDAFQRFEAEWSPEQEIVRCKDCKFKEDGECIIKAGWFPVKDDWFCADGKRR